MTNPTPHGQVPEALRLADLLLNLQTHMGPRRPSHPDDAPAGTGTRNPQQNSAACTQRTKPSAPLMFKTPQKSNTLQVMCRKTGRNQTWHPSPPPRPRQTASQPAPEYVGNGMFKGETIKKAAEHWANWCDRRCMTGLSEFLRVVASRVQADSVLEDAARLDWLDQQCEAYGFQDIHEGNRWEISGAYANVREAIDAERAARKQGGA